VCEKIAGTKDLAPVDSIVPNLRRPWNGLEEVLAIDGRCRPAVGADGRRLVDAAGILGAPSSFTDTSESDFLIIHVDGCLHPEIGEGCRIHFIGLKRVNSDTKQNENLIPRSNLCANPWGVPGSWSAF
jgi:hypothetical protein